MQRSYAGLQVHISLCSAGFNALELGKKIEYLENLLRVITTGSQSNAEMEEVAQVDIISNISLQTKRLVDKIITRPHLGWANDECVGVEWMTAAAAL